MSKAEAFAAAKKRLEEANYRTHQTQHEQRCDGCRHVAPIEGGKQHGRLCLLHRAAVKTHGVCDAFGHKPPRPSEAPSSIVDVAAPSARRHRARPVQGDLFGHGGRS